MFKKNKKKLVAVASGKAIGLESVPDEVFSGKMLGDGFTVEPETGVFFSPADGVIENITDTKHAYTLKTKDGLELLVHIGIDTVELGGEGFSSCVRAGQTVVAGEIIARADLELIRSRGLSTVTPVVISNSDELSNLELSLGRVVGGETAVAKYNK